jgi:hypothetical protein
VPLVELRLPSTGTDNHRLAISFGEFSDRLQFHGQAVERDVCESATLWISDSGESLLERPFLSQLVTISLTRIQGNGGEEGDRRTYLVYIDAVSLHGLWCQGVAFLRVRHLQGFVNSSSGRHLQWSFLYIIVNANEGDWNEGKAYVQSVSSSPWLNTLWRPVGSTPD